jgi:hypothetical protein
VTAPMPARPPHVPIRHRRPAVGLLLGCGAAALVAAGSGCGSAQRPEGLDPATLPSAVRPAYEVFAQRCSRCHSLSRPLNSGFTDMDQWRSYVRRMRRQPNSGISPSDEQVILVFVEYYNQQRTAARSGGAR